MASALDAAEMAAVASHHGTVGEVRDEADFDFLRIHDNCQLR